VTGVALDFILPPTAWVDVDTLAERAWAQCHQRLRARAWRRRIAEQWRDAEILTGDVWADVALGGSGSLLGPLEVVLDALEPVLGRDPRGRGWQEFFPNDHRIVWLRVRRVAKPALRLRLGPIGRREASPGHRAGHLGIGDDCR
jgi:hypothetical protein